MNVAELWTEADPIQIDTDVYDVFEQFGKGIDRPFLPIVDGTGRALGIVRERDLKGYAYSRFGRDLVKRCHVGDFLQPCLTLPSTIGLDDLLDATAGCSCPDGVLISEDGRYRAVLFAPALIQIFGKRHLDTQVRMAQLRKMEAIGTLAGGIAHDLNNMLMPIIGFSELVMESIRLGELPELSMVDDIRLSANRARETVRRIQSFSRHQTVERETIRLGNSIREAIRLIQSSLPKTIDVHMQVETTRDTVHGNSSEMLQVLLNLCSNAAHSMKGRCGSLQVSLGIHTGAVLGWSLCQERLSGDYVRLSVTDCGEGIPESLLPQIFVPFFTTKKQGEGTGMGLAVVHGIVSRCGGHISVETEVGKGTAFHVYLPLVRESVVSPAASQDCSLPRAVRCAKDRPVRVLVVDDEVYITRLAKAALARHGIEVDTENDSREAIRRIEAEPDSFAVLIVDQMMPGVTGIEVARRALELRPGLPVILCTGYTEGITPEEAKEQGVREFVLKPADFAQVASWILHWTAPRLPAPAAPSRSGQHPLANALDRPGRAAAAVVSSVS